MTDKSSADDSRALLKFCRSLFETGNLIGNRLQGCFCNES